MSKLKIHIDRDLCIGAATCVAIAPKAFVLDSEAKSTVLNTVDEEDEKIIGQTFNAGGDNLSVSDIAFIVQNIAEEFKKSKAVIEIQQTNDLRSYHISSQKIERELGWKAKLTVSGAVRNITNAFYQHKIPKPENPKYYNIKTMQLLNVR